MSMYNSHRGMLPQHQPPNTRLTELLEQIRVEFESQAGENGRDQHQRENFSKQELMEQHSQSAQTDEPEVASQISELQMVQRKVYELETAHTNVKAE
jgi:glucose repression regulatory protein TUP1